MGRLKWCPLLLLLFEAREKGKIGARGGWFFFHTVASGGGIIRSQALGPWRKGEAGGFIGQMAEREL